MKDSRKKLILAGAYVLTFVAALVFTCFIENFGIAPQTLTADSGMPAVYVNYEQMLINEMTAYTVAQDGSDIRDSVTPVPDDHTLRFSMRENDYAIKNVTFYLSDNANADGVDRGVLKNIGTQDGYTIYELTFRHPLTPDQQYCLEVTVEAGDATFYYYTRVVAGDSYRAQEKLDFVRDFCEDTFDTDNTTSISYYLETNSAYNDNMTFADVDIYSSASTVTWGQLNPVTSGGISSVIRAIDEDSATIQLLYKVEVNEDSVYTQFNVNEYYTIEWSEAEKMYRLKDFSRSLREIPRSNTLAAGNQMLKLGIVDIDDIGLLTAKTDSGEAAVFTVDGRLWHYDVTDNVSTCIFSMDESREFYGAYPYGVKALRMDTDGRVYFIVYGYMSGGRHAGENGIGIYIFDAAQGTVTETAFVPVAQNWELLKADVEKLAYMSADHLLYICIADQIYRLDYETGREQLFIEGTAASDCAVSGDQSMLAVQKNREDRAGTAIDVYDLNTGDRHTIESEGQILRLLGFFENDLVYGVASKAHIYTDADGTQVVPMNKVVIVNRQFEIVREYEGNGKYIMDADFEGHTMNMTMAVLSEKDGQDVFTLTEGDYLVGNTADADSDILLTQVYDDTRRNEVYLDLPVNLTETPIGQSARVMKAEEYEYDLEIPEVSGEMYYLYTGHGLQGTYRQLEKAVDACTMPSGSIVSNNQTVVWQKKGMPEETRLNIDAIDRGPIIKSVVKLMCMYAENNDSVQVSSDMNLYEALDTNLASHQAASLKGLELEDALFFVNSGRPVIAQLRPGEYVVIVGYNRDYMQIADPTTGEISDWNYRTYKKTFAEQGNIFVSYY